MQEFPQLKTERLLLGKFKVADIPKIVEYAGNINVAGNTLNIPHPYQEDDAIFWMNSVIQGFKNKTQYSFAIRLQSDDSFIGGVGFKMNNRFERAELGYWIAEPFWNQGYTTESVAALLEFGFKVLNLNKIFATHLIENPASGKVMQKNGMIQEGTLIDHVKRGADFKSLIQYRLTKHEFLNR